MYLIEKWRTANYLRKLKFVNKGSSLFVLLMKWVSGEAVVGVGVNFLKNVVLGHLAGSVGRT